MFTLKNKLDKATCLKRLAEEPFRRITLSFYRYVQLEHPREFRDQLFREWSDLGVFGRIYVAKEGINAQLNVPNTILMRLRLIWMQSRSLKICV